MFVQTEITPNPNSLKFLPGKIVSNGGSFEITKKERKHLIEKASICVNGISLTISKVSKKGFHIWVIPHTFNETNLSSLKKNRLVIIF